MPEESKPPSSNKLKLHVINLVACIVALVLLMGFFLIATHNGFVFTENERLGIFGLIASAIGGAVYSAKTLPGAPQ